MCFYKWLAYKPLPVICDMPLWRLTCSTLSSRDCTNLAITTSGLSNMSTICKWTCTQNGRNPSSIDTYWMMLEGEPLVWKLGAGDVFVPSCRVFRHARSSGLLKETSGPDNMEGDPLVIVQCKHTSHSLVYCGVCTLIQLDLSPKRKKCGVLYLEWRMCPD